MLPHLNRLLYLLWLSLFPSDFSSYKLELQLQIPNLYQYKSNHTSYHHFHPSTLPKQLILYLQCLSAIAMHTIAMNYLHINSPNQFVLYNCLHNYTSSTPYLMHSYTFYTFIYNIFAHPSLNTLGKHNDIISF